MEAFDVVMGIAKKIVTHKNYMVKYQSPTDMGISCAGMAITDDEVCCIASTGEIQEERNGIDSKEKEEKAKKNELLSAMSSMKKRKHIAKKRNTI